MSDEALEPRQAAAIVAGMLAVALADGVADPRELALVDARRASLPYGIDVSGARLASPTARRRLVEALLDVAWADGVLHPDEDAVLRELLRAHEVDDALRDEVEAARRRG